MYYFYSLLRVPEIYNCPQRIQLNGIDAWESADEHHTWGYVDHPNNRYRSTISCSLIQPPNEVMNTLNDNNTSSGSSSSSSSAMNKKRSYDETSPYCNTNNNSSSSSNLSDSKKSCTSSSSSSSSSRNTLEGNVDANSVRGVIQTSSHVETIDSSTRTVTLNLLPPLELLPLDIHSTCDVIASPSLVLSDNPHHHLNHKTTFDVTNALKSRNSNSLQSLSVVPDVSWRLPNHVLFEYPQQSQQ